MFWDTWTYPNLYIVLVGPPASRKGTAMRLGRPILEAAGVRVACESVSRKGFMEDFKSATNKDLLDSLIADPIIHSSLTVFSEEFVVFLGADKQFLMDLVNMFDSPDIFRHRTQGGGVEEIQGAWLNILGAITPSLLQATLPNDSAGTGLMSRLIIAYSARKDKKIIYPFIIKENDKLKEALIEDLQSVMSIRGDFHVDESFLREWGNWYGSYDEQSLGLSPKLLGYADRKAKHTLKLCMVMSASRSDDMIITGADLTRALSELQNAEGTMSKALAGVGNRPLASTLQDIAAYVAMKGTCTYAQVVDAFMSDATKDEVRELLVTLRITGYVTIEHGADPMNFTVFSKMGKT